MTKKAVFDYLKAQNRPYNANDVVMGLRGAQKKSVKLSGIVITFIILYLLLI